MKAVKDRLRGGRPRKTTPQEDRVITLTALSRLSSTGLQDLMAHRSLIRWSGTDCTQPISRLKTPRKPAMTAFHRQVRLLWCRQHRQWNLNLWGNVMSSDESRFCLQKVDGVWSKSMQSKYGDEVENAMLLHRWSNRFWCGQCHGVGRYLHHWQHKACHH